MNGHYRKICSLVNAVKRRKRINLSISGMLITFSAAFSAIDITAVLDYFISLAMNARLALLYFTIILFFSLGVLFILFPLLRKISDDSIALLIQDRVKGLSDDLINALQLGRESPGAGRQCVSEDLIEEFIKETALKITFISPELPARVGLKKQFTAFCAAAGIFLLLCVLPPHIMISSLPRILDPAQYEKVNKMLRVEPGNIDLFSGSSLRVEAFIKERRGKPSLSYRYGKSGWVNQKMNQAGETEELRQYEAEIEKLKSDTEYFVKFNRVQSPVYCVRVITLPEVGDIAITYNYPEYTGMAAKMQAAGGGDIEAIYGTKVSISAKANKDLISAQLVTADNKRYDMAVKNGVNLEGAFPLTGEDMYWIEVKDRQGYANRDPVKYGIRILKDENPSVKVLAPDMDVVVSEKSEVCLTCEAKDDFGIKKVDLVYNVTNEPGEETRRITIQRFDAPADEKILNYCWKLESISLKPGTVLSYFIEAYDNDIISGPKKGASRVYYIEVFSYEKEHSGIEEALAGFRDKLLKLLDSEMVSRETLEKYKDQETSGLLEDSAYKQRDVIDDTQNIIGIMEKLFPRMEADPLGDWRTFGEYKTMVENLKYLKDAKMREAVDDINKAIKAEQAKKKDYVEAAKKTQDDIIEELEKMTLLSEDVLQNQKMNDLLSTAQDMVDKQSEFTRALEGAKGREKEKLEALKKMMEEVSEMMKELQRYLKELPQQLPEEFMNQDSVKNLELNRMNDAISNLNKSLMDGDYDKALRYTMDMLDMLSKMMDVLQQASKNVKSTDMKGLSDEAGQHLKELDDIINEQEKVYEQTSKYEDRRLKELLKGQEKLLKMLAEMQKEVIEKTKVMKENALRTLAFDNQNMQGAAGYASMAIEDMQKAYNDMVNPPARKAKEYVKSAVSRLENAGRHLNEMERNLKYGREKTLEPYIKEYEGLKEKKMKEKREGGPDRKWSQKKEESDTDRQKTEALEKKLQELNGDLYKKEEDFQSVNTLWQEVTALEKKILEELEKAGGGTGGVFSKQEKSELEKLSGRQKDLKSRAEQLRQGLKKLSMKTSAIGPEIIGNMDQGASAMGEAGESLSEADTGKAVESEQSALENLAKSREGLKSAKEGMSGMMQFSGRGMPQAGFMQPGGGMLPGGRMGYMDGKVRIPTAEDYQVPKQFRQDLMDALKEKYPQLYEEMIRKYYRRLTE